MARTLANNDYILHADPGQTEQYQHPIGARSHKRSQAGVVD